MDTPHCSSCEITIRPTPLKEDMLLRLKRIEGQIRGVAQMIERDSYCDHVLHQLAAARSALESVGKLVLEYHLKSCVVDRIRKDDPAIVEELLGTIKTLLR